ncbi:biotin-dependent carboxyltransferase family protein [Sabulilitoribacter multivorans]|uniref:Biotin-dependent carboxyltransferase family protein n=1 Tax=Flaviramulus multivorans TaxID=1304750 RepID=A0ABS9IHW8_9FLAO|nr:biotin-dependent carboxyltransferase family protein [Flaviramulus multivorans]MCF7560163.1 biotin-dependent carboxyltransferase family protein [Flaviramulus multivorans]
MIKVLKPGFYSTIQDLGRIGFQQFGVPYSGVMDRKAATVANALLGNDESDAVIEMTMTGATFQFSTNTFIAISGADMSPKLNNQAIQCNKMVAVKFNDVLSFGKLNTGFRCYLAVLGGFNTEIVMNSKSMYKNITEQSVIKKDDDLMIFKDSITNISHHASIRFNTDYINSNIIEVHRGPEFYFLSENQQKALFATDFSISKDNNRMAYQMEETFQNNLKPIITSAVLPGTVQLTPSGKLIVLMRDCQTTGGYPRVLQLTESAINIIAQKFTGNTIRFKLIPQN